MSRVVVRTAHDRNGTAEPRTMETRGQDPPSVARRFGPILDIEGVREHVQCAIALEHATLPPDLCAMYSLDPARNADAAERS